MKVRLQKYLSQCGVASRREAEELIWEGRVKVNGQVVDKMGVKVDPYNDVVKVGRKIIQPLEKVYYVVNKPMGYVSTVKDKYAQKKVTDLVPPTPPVYPVGRLDKETEGLILLTNDGELTNYFTSPKSNIDKEYEVVCRARREDMKLDKAIKHLQVGVFIDGYKTKPAKVTKLHEKDSKIYFNIVIKEGKNRQIRRMCHNVGMKVLKLRRIRIGKLKLGNLAKGKYYKSAKFKV